MQCRSKPSSLGKIQEKWMLICKPDLLMDRQWSTSIQEHWPHRRGIRACSTGRIPKTWPKTSDWLGIILKDLHSLPETPHATPKLFYLSCFKRRWWKGFCLKVLLRIQANISSYGSKKNLMLPKSQQGDCDSNKVASYIGPGNNSEAPLWVGLPHTGEHFPAASP